MKIENYGKAALITGAVAWTVLVVFTLLAWYVVMPIKLANGPKVLTGDIHLNVLFAIEACSFPLSICAVIFSVIAFFKKKNLIPAIVGFLLGALLLAIWVAGYIVVVLYGGV